MPDPVSSASFWLGFLFVEVALQLIIPNKRWAGVVMGITGLCFLGYAFGWFPFVGFFDHAPKQGGRRDYLSIIFLACLLIAFAIQLFMLVQMFKGRVTRFFAPALVVKSTDTTSGLTIGISPDAIRAEVKSRPPFERTIAAKKYEGIAVEWSGKFYDLFMVGSERVRLHIFVNSTTGAWDAMIMVEVSLSEYPTIKILTPGTRIRMQGRIKTVTVGMPEYIELEDAKLFIG